MHFTPELDGSRANKIIMNFAYNKGYGDEGPTTITICTSPMGSVGHDKWPTMEGPQLSITCTMTPNALYDALESNQLISYGPIGNKIIYGISFYPLHGSIDTDEFGRAMIETTRQGINDAWST